jgi:ligand-binding SRPBCC domain-containing protein
MELCFEHVVEAPVERVFAFHASPAHLATLHRDSTAFRLLHHDGDVRPGSTTWFEQKLTGFLPVVLGFRHVTYEPPRRFGEELIHGPYDRFVHVHEFEPHPRGTLVRDRLELAVPWQYGGTLVLRLLVAPRIRAAFVARQAALRTLVSRGALDAAA